ncbi:MAG: hypothetical protein K9I84_07450 [Leadbetterella sp.]|nr:hypothetical protein [Leadbetterella sp.]
MLTVYAEKDIFENIVIFNDRTPNWYNIFCNHSEVCLNITDAELEAEEIEGTPIFEFIKATGGRSVIALKEYFGSIYDDNSVIAAKPRSVFFLSYSAAEAEVIQNSYGVIVQSAESINDDILTGSYKRKLLKDEEIVEGAIFGWKSLLQFAFPPSNSVVISDNYLLQSTERVGANYVASGKSNILWMLDAILPVSLSIPYHVTIISEDNNQNEAWRNRVAGQLNAEINNLRNYDINVEVVFIKSEMLHERLLLMNYVNSSCEHGFYLFKAKDGRTVHVVNKLQINSYFSALNNSQGESEYQIANKDLSLLKKVCNELAAHIDAGNPVYRGAILGGCNPNKSLKNRLINDV